MAKELRSIDITNIPDLLRLAEETRASGEARVLRRDNEALAILTPVPASTKRSATRAAMRARSKEDFEAFRAAAGSWSDVDTDQFIVGNAESRRRQTRPPIVL
jgi:hypothetical protein